MEIGIDYLPKYTVIIIIIIIIIIIGKNVKQPLYRP
jgi:hypothetical protein